jgi:hypothetical protein
MDALPKKLASYIHDTGLRALDHLAEITPPAAEGADPDVLQILVGRWRALTPEQKDDFVTRVSGSVGEVIAASALLPMGVKLGKKAVKSAKKVLKRSAKRIKKNAKAAKKKKPKVKAPAVKKTRRRAAKKKTARKRAT